jgi:hypothetical protein
MSAAPTHAPPVPPDYPQLLQRLEMLELQADLDARNIAQLREQNKQLDDVLSAERACGDKHAEAFMRIARTCDDRVDELKTQHANVIVAMDTTIAQLKAIAAASAVSLQEMKTEMVALRAANAAAVVKLETEKADLKAQMAMLQAQALSKLIF